MNENIFENIALDGKSYRATSWQEMIADLRNKKRAWESENADMIVHAQSVGSALSEVSEKPFHAKILISQLVLTIEIDPEDQHPHAEVTIDVASIGFDSINSHCIESELEREEEAQEEEAYRANLYPSSTQVGKWLVVDMNVYEIIDGLMDFATDDEIHLLVLRDAAMYEGRFSSNEKEPGIWLMKKPDGTLAVHGNIREVALWQRI